MSEKFIVVLSSEVYGPETFSRDNLDEALDTVHNLVRSCIEEYNKDHVVRRVTVEIGTSDEI
jgi:hypothetical protein